MSPDNIMKFIIFVLIMILSFPCYGEPGTNHKQVVQEITQGLEEGKKHDWASALKHFEKATVLDPKSSWAWSNHGTAWLNLNEPKKAIKSYHQAVELNPSDPYNYCSLASAKFRLYKPKEALEHANKALSVDPKFAPAMANKARALRALGKPKDAYALMQKAYRLMPRLKDAFEE